MVAVRDTQAVKVNMGVTTAPKLAAVAVAATVVAEHSQVVQVETLDKMVKVLPMVVVVELKDTPLSV